MAKGRYVKAFVQEGIVDIEGNAELHKLFCGLDDFEAEPARHEFDDLMEIPDIDWVVSE